MNKDLKPVPCGCGGEAKVISYLSREYCKMAYYVRCVECGTETDDLHSEAEAVEAWNRRVATDTKDGSKERTAKVIEHDASVTDTDGYKYHRSEYLCGACKKKGTER